MHHAKRQSKLDPTKRAGEDGGSRRTVRAARDVAVCPRCSAVLVDRRWTRVEAVGETDSTARRPPQRVCPACRKAHARHPEGIVNVQGEFVAGHIGEIERVLRSEEARVAKEHPLARIIALGRSDGTRLLVTTTTGRLAHRLGHALQTSLGGTVESASFPTERVTRVTWMHN
jgi:hypothetical protein